MSMDKSKADVPHQHGGYLTKATAPNFSELPAASSSDQCPPDILTAQPPILSV